MARRWELIPFFLALFACRTVGHAAQADGRRPIQVEVEASRASRRLFHAHLKIPATPGPLTLVYPKWIPGEHGPTGPLADLAGLVISSGGKAVPWRRDDLDMHAILCEVPAGADALEVKLDYLPPPPGTEGFISAQASAKTAVFSWNQMLLVPKGPSMGQTLLQPSVVVPAGWKFSTALRVASRSESRASFEPVTLETLVDSPVLCGEHLVEIPIGPAEGPPHFLCLAADSAKGLQLAPATKSAFDRLVVEAGALFGARHYRSYRFFLALSDLTPPFFLEHHETSDNRAPERTLLDENLQKRWLFILAHEYAHSWNGKYRRPADMVVPDFQQPISTRLLWVYEGLTEYLGCLLAARSGIWTAEDFRDNLALAADWLGNQKGRQWRPLEDTTRAAQTLYPARNDWASWRRGVDFYNEGLLLWLEVDAVIRRGTRGQKSLDDWLRSFHGGPGGMPLVKPYTQEEVEDSLSRVADYDWKRFFLERVSNVAPDPPVGGIRIGGWKVSYSPAPSAMYKIKEATDKTIDLTTSIGLLAKEDGSLVDVVPGKSADRAGIGPGMKIIAVNSRRYSSDLLRETVGSTSAGEKLELLVENAGFFRTCALDYTGGEKYPRLEREGETADLLAEILKPLATK